MEAALVARYAAQTLATPLPQGGYEPSPQLRFELAELRPRMAVARRCRRFLPEIGIVVAEQFIWVINEPGEELVAVGGSVQDAQNVFFGKGCPPI